MAEKVGDFSIEKLIVGNIVQSINKYLTGMRSTSTHLRIILNNPIISSISKYIVTISVISATKKIASVLSVVAGHICEWLSNTFLKLFCNVEIFGFEGDANRNKTFDGVIELNNVEHVLSDLKISAGIHFIDRSPIFIDRCKNKNDSEYLKIWYPKQFSGGFNYLIGLARKDMKVFKLKKDHPQKWNYSDFKIKLMNPGKPEDKTNHYWKTLSYSKSSYNVFSYEEYVKTFNIISDYLEIINKIEVEMPPLVIVYNGSPGVGKSMFLNYVQYNYDICCARISIISQVNSNDDLNEMFDFILGEIQNLYGHTKMINIDELDKVYGNYVSIMTDKGVNAKDLFLDKLFTFISNLRDGIIIVLTMNQAHELFDKNTINKRHLPLIDRMIFQEIREYNYNDVCSYLSFYNNGLKDTRFYNPNLRKILNRIKRDISISARKLTQILLTSRMNFELAVMSIS